MSEHSLKLDVQKVAVVVQTLRAQLDELEKLIEDSLIQEAYDRINPTVNSGS